MNSWSLAVAADDQWRLAAFESAIVVELVGETPLGLANEHVLWTLDKVKGVVCHVPIERFDHANCAPLFFIRPTPDLLVAYGRRQNISAVSCGDVEAEHHVVVHLNEREVVVVEVGQVEKGCKQSSRVRRIARAKAPGWWAVCR
eukprot:2542584-Pleurochrysis_carterae.AAC.1